MVGVPRETFTNECRVAGTPETVAKLVQQGLRVRVEAGAGERAGFSDEMYVKAGATVVKSPAEVWASDVVTKVRPPTEAEAGMLGDRMLISMVQPNQNPHLVEAFKRQGATVFGRW